MRDIQDVNNTTTSEKGSTVKKAEIMQELDARNIEYDKKSRKDDLAALLNQDTEEKSVETDQEPQEKVVIPEKRVTSKYDYEQEKIDEAYELVYENLDKSKTWLIREVQKIGVPTSYISKMLGAHYSFVHTVISNAGLGVVEKRTKSDEMREKFEEGYTVAQVSKELGAHYSYVHGVHKRWKEKVGQ